MNAIVCPSCRALLEPALPLCVACGRVFSEPEEEARALVIRRLPDDRPARSELEQLLAAASGRDEPALARYLESGGVVFRLPVSALVAARLQEALEELGAAVEVVDRLTPETTWSAWARTLWAERRAEMVLAGGGGLAALTVFHGAGPFLLWMMLSGGLAALDVRGFQRRITLSPAVLSRRLGLAAGTLVRPAAALLRRAHSPALREALGAALIEHARLLAAVARALAAHPALQGPFLQALDEVGDHTLRAAENAVVIEEASASSERDELPGRLAQLRGLGTVETDRQLRQLLASRDQRQARNEWLRHAHALLLIRLEAITERLRALRQETAHHLLEVAVPDPGAADRSLAALSRELELAASSLAEVERGLPQPLPEVIAQIVG